MACKTYGPGRLAPVETIVDYVAGLLARAQDLKGRRVLVTAGPTVEDIDPVRFHQQSIVREDGIRHRACGARPRRRSDLDFRADGAGVSRSRARALHRRDARGRGRTRFDQVDVVIKAAAPLDFRPKDRRRAEDQEERRPRPRIELEPTPDILQELGARKNGKVLVGFAAETEDFAKNARAKLKAKNLDLIVVNPVGGPDSGFDSDTNRASIIDAAGGGAGSSAREQSQNGGCHSGSRCCAVGQTKSQSGCIGPQLATRGIANDKSGHHPATWNSFGDIGVESVSDLGAAEPCCCTSALSDCRRDRRVSSWQYDCCPMIFNLGSLLRDPRRHPRRHRRLPALQARANAHQHRFRFRKSKRRTRVCRRSAGLRRRSAGLALCRRGRAVADKDHRVHGHQARRCLHLQHPEVPAAGKSQSRARRSLRLQSVSQTPARGDPPKDCLLPREVCRSDGAAKRRADLAACAASFTTSTACASSPRSIPPIFCARPRRSAKSGKT